MMLHDMFNSLPQKKVRVLCGLSMGDIVNEGVAQRALGPPPPRPVLRTAETAMALAVNPSTAVCTDGCAGGTCINGHARTFVPAAILAATAPAVANPYTNAAGGTAAGTVGVVGGAAGAIVAPNDITPAAVVYAAAAGGKPPPTAMPKVHVGISCPAPSRRRSSLELTLVCSS